MRKLPRQGLGWLLALALPITLCGCQDAQTDDPDQQPDLPQQTVEQPQPETDNTGNEAADPANTADTPQDAATDALTCPHCGYPNIEQNAAPADDEPTLLYLSPFDGRTGIINTNGEVIVPPTYADTNIISPNNEPQYIARKTTLRDANGKENGAEYNFYSPNGTLLRTDKLHDMGDVDLLGNYNNGAYLCDMTAFGGNIIVKDTDCVTILEIPINYQNAEFDYTYTELRWEENWFWLSYQVYGFINGSQALLNAGSGFYTHSGEPIKTAQDYSYVSSLSSIYSNREYYEAAYTSPNGEKLYDVLDENLQPVLTGFTAIFQHADDAILCVKDSLYGLMDMNGNWLYSQPRYPEHNQ